MSWLITNPQTPTTEYKYSKLSLSQIIHDSFGYVMPITNIATRYSTTLQLSSQLYYYNTSQPLTYPHGLKKPEVIT